MKKICNSVSKLKNPSSIKAIEEIYKIEFPNVMVDFFTANNGGIPANREFTVNGQEYEIRCFLSFNENEYNSIHRAIDSYQKETNGKIVPIAKDSGDNYFCLNIETGNIFYNDNADGLYYKLFDSFSDLVDAVK